MELYFLNGDFSLLAGPEEDFTSVVWEERYFEPGSFTLHFPRSLLPRIAEAVYVRTGVLPGSSSADRILCGRIETLTAGEDGDCEMGGRMLECLLADRVIAGCSSCSGDLTAGVLSVVRDNLRDCGVTVGEDQPQLPQNGEEGALSWDWDNLSDWLYAVLRPLGASYRITLDPETMLPVFRLVMGADRTGGDGPSGTQAVFSVSFGNVLSLRLERDGGSLRNFAYVEGRDGTVVTVDRSGSSPVREICRTASDVDPGDFDSEADYRAALIRRGEELLAKYPEGLSVSAECDPNALPRYGEDYFLGDVCSVADDELGVCFSLRLTALDRVWEDGRETLYPSFGEELRGVKKLLSKLQ